MKSIAILTNSYAPDYERFTRLHRSVLEHTGDDVSHYVIVPARDYQLFRGIASHRLTVWKEGEVLPSHVRPTDRLAAMMRRIPGIPSTLRCSAINVRRPWPPLRGWVLQQILKFAAVARIGADAILVIDSDVVLVRDLDTGMFFLGEAVRLYDEPGAIEPSMERHVEWVRAAHRLLGIQPPAAGALPDNVAGVVTWDREVVAACLARVEEATGHDWATAFGAELHVSEFVLYGAYVRHFGTPEQRSFMEPTTLCHSHWSPTAMRREELQDFIEGFGPLDIALHVQSNSQTSTEIVDQLVAAIERPSGRIGERP